MIVASTPAEINRFVAVTLKAGLKLYLKTGMQPNRMWTITNMLKAVGKMTGKTYKRGQGEMALRDITALLEG